MKKQLISLLILVWGAHVSAQVASGDKLEFTYDTAGNQTLRDVPAPAKASDEVFETVQNNLINLEKESIANAFIVAPNPTSGEVTLQWNPELSEQITSIELVSLVTSQRSAISFRRNNSVSVDLSEKAAGLYLVIFHLNNETVLTIQKKIIKL